MEKGTEIDLGPIEPWPWLDEAELARENPTIFHYTRLNVLPDILKSGGLFAARYNATNDPEELHSLRHPMATLMAMSATPLLEYATALGRFHPPEDLDLHEAALEEAAQFHDIMIHALPKPLPSITCFSSHKDDHHKKNGILTMWRLYGLEEGVALGFDAKKLIEITEDIQKTEAVSGIYLDRVLYGLQDAELVRRVLQSSEVVHQFARTLMSMLDADIEMPPLRSSTLHKFLRLVCCSKHADFSDEREIRLVVMESDDRMAKGRSRLLQPVPDKILVRYLGALKEIMVGPGESQVAATKQVRQCLDEAGFEAVPVTTSQIQFRFLKG